MRKESTHEDYANRARSLTGEKSVRGICESQELSQKKDSRPKWPGNDGVRHPRWCPCGHRHHRHHIVQAEDPRALGRHCQRHQWLVGDRGQGTVEYAIITVAFLGIITACGMIFRAFEAGAFVEHALDSASHSMHASVGWITDVFSF